MNQNWDRLPDGTRFAFWEDETSYCKTYHVARGHRAASDENSGTEARPFATIGRAAELLEPGERVVVHEGVYRECVRPARGGEGPDRMISYEAASGETVVISGSEEWRPDARPSEGWARRSGDSPPIWMADLPADVCNGYNPFRLRNAYEYLDTYADVTDSDFLRRAMLRRGAVYVEGRPLTQVYRFSDLGLTDGAFWVEEPGLRLHFRLPGDADPAGVVLEVSAREQAFAPAARGLGFLRVRGFRFRHAADGLPVPQRACVSTSRGHHWIIEDNRIEWVNAVGMDLGAQHWSAEVPELSGHHVVRRNTIRQCGICGIAGAKGVYHTLIEDNVVEHIGSLNLERMWECAGLKFHLCRHCLFRGNVFRHLRHAGGLWLDCSNVNNRITDNVFADIASLTGAVYSEMNYDANLVDHNVFWDCRRAPDGETDEAAPAALRCDCNETLAAAHNFFGRLAGDAVEFGLQQFNRRHQGRTAVCRANSALNNVLYACSRRVSFGRLESNRSDGNLFDERDDACSFRILHPEPSCLQNLVGWQRFFGQDLHSTQAQIEAEFDVETLTLRWRVRGEVPTCLPVEALAQDDAPAAPGPFDPAQWKESLRGEGVQTFPVRAWGAAATQT